MKKGGRRKRIILWCVLGVIAFLIIFAASFMLAGQSSIKNMEIKNVAADRVADGVYTGSFQGYRWSNTVEVTVSGGQLTDIRIIKDQRLAVPDVSAKLFASVIEKQSVAVDVVSGATVSSKAYLKAVEEALSGQ